MLPVQKHICEQLPGAVHSAMSRLGGQQVEIHTEQGRGCLPALLRWGVEHHLATGRPAQPGIGGQFLLEMEYAYSGSEASASIHALTERFDYGILARRVNPESEIGGMLTLDLDIEGRYIIPREML